MKRVAELEKLRSEIDDCDTQIRALIRRRVSIVRKIASAKVAAGIHMHDARRETDILEQPIDETCEIEATLIRDIYGIIFQSGRQIWRQFKERS